MPDRNERIQEAHEQGQKDGASYSKHELPHFGVLSDLDSTFLHDKEERETRNAENDAYKSGYENATKQR